MNKLLGFVGVIVALIAVTAFVSRSGPSTPTSDGSPQVAGAAISINESDHTKGTATPSATLVEYSDFQCPACGAFHAPVKQLTEEFGEDLQFVYRHFPLTTSHKHAESAAIASEAAAKQGKFWEMHDLLFTRQAEWSGVIVPEEKYFEYAEGLGVNMEQFRLDFGSDELREKVRAQQQSGFDAQVSSTPSFFLNGSPIQGLNSYDDLRNVVTSAISASSQ